jgi:hypothetical protein
MAQLGKQTWVGARESFAQRTAELVLVGNKNSYGVDSITISLQVVKLSFHSKGNVLSQLLPF